MDNRNEKGEVDKIIVLYVKEITTNASDRFRQITYEKKFYGMPDSISDFLGEIAVCYTFGHFKACISLIGSCLEEALKSELVRKLNQEKNEKEGEIEKLTSLGLGQTLGISECRNLLQDKEIFDKAGEVNKIRNTHVHANLSKIKEVFEDGVYNQMSEWIQALSKRREEAEDGLNMYKNLMTILEYLYSEKRYPL